MWWNNAAKIYRVIKIQTKLKHFLATVKTVMTLLYK